MNLYKTLFKPLIDRAGALVLLIVASPVIILVALALYVVNSGRIWFTQQRPGKDGVLFTVIKFRTMNDARDAEGRLLADSERLTPVGRFVRKTSLDELPQLFNVLKGDMSFVGPRPLLTEYLPLYSAEQGRRHEVKPGITGWAQVNGRNTVKWPQRFAFDVWYVDHLSFGLDFKIFVMTVMKVLKAEGISSGTSVTMEKFNGNNEDHTDRGWAARQGST